MYTNAGTGKIILQGGVYKFVYVWFDPTQMSNIFGLSHLSDKYHTTYNNWEEDAFQVHSDDGIIKLNQTNEVLYAYNIKGTYVNIVASENTMQPPPRTEINNMVSTLK